MASKRDPKLQAFMQWISYSLGQVDFELVEKDNMTETYYQAMQFYEKKFGNADKNRLTQEDIEFLLVLQKQPLSGNEIGLRMSFTAKTTNNRIAKAMEKMLISTFYQEKVRYYKLTEYGRARVREAILEMEEYNV